AAGPGVATPGGGPATWAGRATGRTGPQATAKRNVPTRVPIPLITRYPPPGRSRPGLIRRPLRSRRGLPVGPEGIVPDGRLPNHRTSGSDRPEGRAGPESATDEHIQT